MPDEELEFFRPAMLERRDAWERRAELVGAIIEVEFKGLTDDGRLREPVVKLVREDR